jgi:acyl-CoA thioesterase FadM
LSKTYFRYLTHEDRVRCQIELEKGQVGRFVIQYEIFVEGEWAAVTRFDTSHDAVHRDLISPNGTVTKK